MESSPRPPIAAVPVVAHCDGCGQTFRTTVNWLTDAAQLQERGCPGCGAMVVLDRDRHGRPGETVR